MGASPDWGRRLGQASGGEIAPLGWVMAARLPNSMRTTGRGRLEDSPDGGSKENLIFMHPFLTTTSVSEIADTAEEFVDYVGWFSMPQMRGVRNAAHP